MPIKIALRAHEFPTLLDRAPPDVRTLSLDCFDTLLWRNSQGPVDVFADLGIEGGSIEPRVLAERFARRRRKFETGRNEVSIEDIHRHLTGSDDADAIARSVARELDAEARHCFGFEPAVTLLLDAKARGWQVVVVSDTYLNAIQLRTLIARSAGAAVAGAIDRIFTSSEYGISKGEGLFKPVLADLDVPPAAILHLGDNPNADQAAPCALGLSTAHFIQFDQATSHRLRLEAAAAVMLDAAVRLDKAAVQPHRALLSLRDDDDPAWILGHDVVGPLMHSFAGWVRDEAAALAAEMGRPVKPVFLMRDGYLPMKMFETLPGAGGAAAVSISRITAGCASFADAAAVRDFLLKEGPGNRADVLAGLLLLDTAETARLLGRDDTVEGLYRAVLAKPWIDTIIRRSNDYADRLVAHVRRAGIAAGDVMLLIDLGYNGSVQNHVDRVLRERMGIAVAGRYLVHREQEPSRLDKKGYFDTRHYDRRTLETLCTSIAVLEQLSTVAEGSVVDYEPDGRPIRGSVGIKGAQSAVRDRIQAAAIAYGAAAARSGTTGAASDGQDARRQMSAAILARFLSLPMEQEVRLLAAFDHDVNLGTAYKMKLIDAERSAAELRRRGLSYVQHAARMFLPGELQGQGQGLALNLSLFSVSRLGLDLRTSDFQVGALCVPVIMADATRQDILPIEAYPTHDGYYAMAIPIGAGQFTLGVQLGAVCEVVQIEDAKFYRVEAPDERGLPPRSIPASTMHDGMHPVAEGLFRCDANGVLLVPPPGGTGSDPLMLSLVFRPVLRRTAVALQLAA